jgi:ferredoxin-NADP reductase
VKFLSLAAQKFTGLLDNINDRLTSYRLVLYFLLVLVGWGALGSAIGKVPYSWHQILVSAVWLTAICWLSNKLISKFLDIPANKESELITALILTLILTPPTTAKDFAVTAGAALTAIASKYVIIFNRSHVFNPAAAGAVVSGLFFNQYASWWVGTKFMTPVVAIGALLVLRKMKRFQMAAVFLAVFVLYLIYGTNSGGNLHFLWLELIGTQALFFSVIMLTEPQTSPTGTKWYLSYAAIVGVGYSAAKLKLSPEEALLVGNVFAFVFARNRRYQLKFISKVKEADGIYSYAFSLPARFKFKAGQYLEWTLAHNKTDSRGNRRYLTISSSPTEPGLMFTIKIPTDKPSAFKQRLDSLKPGDTILASRLAGSFTLPNDPAKKVALLAGGVGITPFRSMAKYIIDSGQPRDVALLYSVNSPAELAFQSLFSQARPLGLKPMYLAEGHFDEAKIRTLLPDFKDRRFYLSGPFGFVDAMERTLLKLGVGGHEIVTDYFPGYGG